MADQKLNWADAPYMLTSRVAAEPAAAMESVSAPTAKAVTNFFMSFLLSLIIRVIFRIIFDPSYNP